jgi:hypothetical protein
MIEPVYVPYKQYRVAKTRCGLDSRIYGNSELVKESSVETVYGHRNCLIQGFLHLTMHRIVCGCLLGVEGLSPRWQ